MIDYAYEDLEMEAAKEREEHERYEAECAKEDEVYRRGMIEELKAFEPTPTKAQKVKHDAELVLECMREDGTSSYNDRLIYHLVIELAKAIDER